MLDGLIFPSADKPWTGGNHILSLASITVCCLHPTPCQAHREVSCPPSHPCQVCSLAEPFWRLAGISGTKEISDLCNVSYDCTVFVEMQLQSSMLVAEKAAKNLSHS